MFSHLMIGTNDIDRAKTFYDATFATFGGPEGIVDHKKGRLIYVHNGGIFILTLPINGEPATCANGFTVGFAMTPEQADAWHAAGLEHGGTPCEDPPGPRQGSPYYLAYLRDPDGHKICALHNYGQVQ
ncbi:MULTISPECIES: VOC family protein [unclassified Sphingomonas]|uniref:VOC family protein n=1 Tax=Novosphingobium rhizosphaerae TaxID=1551649 RepID=UPI0015C829B6